MPQPVREAFGAFLGRYYAALTPTTPAMQRYVVRGLGNAMVWAPSRMVDAAEEMLSAYLRSDPDNTATSPPEMPVIIVAVAKDGIPTGRDFTIQVADSIEMMLPDDPKGRMFGVRAAATDIRAQVAFFALDEPTARSLATQFLLFLDAPANRSFGATYSFAGMELGDWPVQIETPEVPAMAIQTDAKNLTILVVDVTLRAEIPFFDAPKSGQPNDGKGVPGTDDPAGYPVVVVTEGTIVEAGP